MWRENANPDTLIGQFPSLVEREVPTRGSFGADFELSLSNYSVVRCPFIGVSTKDEFERIAITNATIDLSNWRAMLLATLATGSKVREIYVHGCLLSPQHVTDLGIAASKATFPLSLVLQFCSFDMGEEAVEKYADAFCGLFQESIGIEFVSLKGNKLTDPHLNKIVGNLSNNQRLKGINLSENQLTDAFAQLLLNSLRYTHTLQALSLSGNLLSSTSLLSTLFGLYTGLPITGSDEGTIKILTKSTGDKNKAVKEINKKRKKAGIPDAEEISPLPDFIKTIDGLKLFVNSSLKFADFSNNSFAGNEVSASIQEYENLKRIQEAGNKIILSDWEGLRSTAAEGWLLLV